MLAGGFNQKIRENSYFFTIIYFTGSGGEGEGLGKESFQQGRGWQLTVQGAIGLPTIVKQELDFLTGEYWSEYLAPAIKNL